LKEITVLVFLLDSFAGILDCIDMFL